MYLYLGEYSINFDLKRKLIHERKNKNTHKVNLFEAKMAYNYTYTLEGMINYNLEELHLKEKYKIILIIDSLEPGSVSTYISVFALAVDLVANYPAIKKNIPEIEKDVRHAITRYEHSLSDKMNMEVISSDIDFSDKKRKSYEKGNKRKHHERKIHKRLSKRHKNKL